MRVSVVLTECFFVIVVFDSLYSLVDWERRSWRSSRGVLSVGFDGKFHRGERHHTAGNSRSAEAGRDGMQPVVAAFVERVVTTCRVCFTYGSAVPGIV